MNTTTQIVNRVRHKVERRSRHNEGLAIYAEVLRAELAYARNGGASSATMKAFELELRAARVRAGREY